MNDASCKIAKIARCRIARHVIGSADVMFSGDGEIYSVDMDDIREVLDTDIIDEYDVQDDFITNYIKDCFEQAEINVCEY